MTSTFVTIDRATPELVADQLVTVRRRPSETDALYLEAGRYRIATASGSIDVEGPTWVLWDSGGDPYPVTPAEFERLYDQA